MSPFLGLSTYGLPVPGHFGVNVINSSYLEHRVINTDSTALREPGDVRDGAIRSRITRRHKEHDGYSHFRQHLAVRALCNRTARRAVILNG
jgi:hypothetical protein